MANRKRTNEEKVRAVEAALNEINIEAASRKAGVPASTLHFDLGKVKKALSEILSNKKPGPKAQKPKKKLKLRPEWLRVCPKCGGKLNKNGTYQVLNWLLMFMFGLMGIQRVLIQRYRCRLCGYEAVSPVRARQNEARRAWWSQVNRLICLCKFKLRLSVRLTQLLIKFLYSRQVSIGYIENLTYQIGKRAETALSRFNNCMQKTARFLLYDETFPKMIKRIYSLGVVICEHGLIRSVRCIVDKAKDIPAQLKDVVGPCFLPEYFLTDLDVLFNNFMKKAWLKLTHLRDIVHLIRQIVRLFVDAVRNVTLDVPKGLGIKERKKQLKLKQRLLYKRLKPMLDIVFKAFSKGHEGVCVLMLEAVVSQLLYPSCIIQTASIQMLAKRLQRFINKHRLAINTLLELSVEQGTPTTTNSLESKNSILKLFRLIAKYFSSPVRCQSFFAGVALIENFDIKTRGKNKGTNAMQRAKIDSNDFGAKDFFTTVGLENPQIIMA